MNPSLREIMRVLDQASADPANGLSVLEAMFTMSDDAKRILSDLLIVSASGGDLDWKGHWAEYVDTL